MHRTSEGEGGEIAYVEATSDQVWWASEGNRVFVAILLSPENQIKDVLSILMAKPETNEVTVVYTIPEYRRTSLASTLLAIARKETGENLDRDDGTRSDEGWSWGQSQGLEQGEGPNWRQVKSPDLNGQGIMFEFYNAFASGVVDLRLVSA